MYIYDVSIRRKPLVCGLHGNQTKKRSSTANKIPQKYDIVFISCQAQNSNAIWSRFCIRPIHGNFSSNIIGKILIRCRRWNFTRSMVVHWLLVADREEKPQRQAEYDRSCHNYVQCAIKKILECLSLNFRNVIKIMLTLFIPTCS